MAAAPTKRLLTELGFQGGINRDFPQHAIAENEAFYIQDALVHLPGYTQRRGPIQPASGVSFLPAGTRLDGLGSVVDPLGVTKYAVLVNNGSKVQLILRDLTGSVSQTNDQYTIGISSGTPPYIMDVKPCQGGGVLIGIRPGYTFNYPAGKGKILHWRGATKTGYSTGTVATTNGSRTLTGTGTAWLANVEPGMFATLTAGGQLLGVVKAVNSDTDITLEAQVYYGTASGQGVTFTALRNLPTSAVAVGRITCTTGSAVINGGGTKFVDQGVLNGKQVYVWQGSDLSLLGTVSSVQSNSQLTLGANAAVAATNAKFVILNSSSTPLANNGFLNAFWNGMQFTANQDQTLPAGNGTDIIWVADPLTIDAIDTSKEGTYLKLPSTNTASQITALIPTENGLLAFREHETYLITGNSPSTLKSIKLHDDGCYSAMAVATYGPGCIWPGRKSIWRFNGTQVIDLLENKARAYYQQNVGTQDLETYRWYGMEQNDHYMLSSVYQNNIQKALSQTGTNQAWILNLKTGALTFFTNLSIRGAVKVPQLGTVYAWQADNPLGSGTQGYLALASDLFKDTISVAEQVGFGWGSEASTGADMLIETKLYDAGNPEQAKRWKQIQLWSNTMIPILLSVNSGLQKTSVLSNFTFAGSYGDWKNKLFKFNSTDTHISFIFKFTSVGVNGKALIGPMAITYKPLRIGRIVVTP